MDERLERVARAKLSDRLFVAVASSCANEGQAWQVTSAVLAELAGEIRDAERWKVWSRHVGRPQRHDLGPQIPAQTWAVLVTGLQDNISDAADDLIRSNTPCTTIDEARG